MSSGYRAECHTKLRPGAVCGHDATSHFMDLVRDLSFNDGKMIHERGACLCGGCDCKHYTPPPKA